MRAHQNLGVLPSRSPALSSMDSQNGALRVGSGNLQPTGPPIVTQTKLYYSLERTNYSRSRNKKAKAASVRRKRRTNGHAPDGIFTKAELQSDRYITYRAKQRDKPEGIWSDKLEAIFQQALREIPNLGKKKMDCDPRKCGSFAVSRASGRNEHITHFIQNRTGEYRCRKQVSSHIQVLKHFRKDNEEWLRLETKPDPDTDTYTINVHHRYPIHEMPAHASDSFNIPATSMVVNSSLSTEMLTSTLAGHRFSPSMPGSNIPIIETCTSQMFHFHPNQLTPSSRRYHPSSQAMGQMDLQFLPNTFYSHKQNSGQDIPRQIPSDQMDLLQTSDIRDQDFTNCMPNQLSFFDDHRDPHNGHLTSSTTPAPLASMLDRQVHNLGMPQYPQLKSSQPSNPHGDLFADIENQWVHHDGPVGSSSGDGSCDSFDHVYAWPVPMDQINIDTWTINLKCDNTANHSPHQSDQNHNKNHHQQQHGSTPSATTPSHHHRSLPGQHQPEEEPDHVADLLAQTDHPAQLPTNVDMGGVVDAEGDLDVNLDVAGPHAPQQEEDLLM